MNVSIACVLVASVGLAAVALMRGSRSDERSPDISASTAAALFFAASAIHVSILLVMRKAGFVLFTMDEAVRADIACGWARSPYFFTWWDGIWLSGGFAYYGTFIRLLGDAVLGIQFGALFGGVLVAVGAFYLAWTLSGRLWIGALASSLFAPAYPYLWFGHGALIEAPIAGVFMLAFAECWRLAVAPSGDARRIGLHAGLASLLLFLTASMHYVGWMAIAAGAPFSFVALWRGGRLRPGAGRGPAIVVLAGAALFPILWAIGSAHHLGHPLQFLRNQARVAEFYMGQLGRENAALSNFIAHPRELARQAGILIPLLAGLGLVGITRMPGARPVVIVATYVAALILIMSLVSIKAGYGAPPRSLTIVYSMTLVLAALVFQVVERGLFGGARVGRTARLAARASTALFAVGWLGFNGLMAHRYETYGDDVRHDTLALGAWLQQEIRRPQFMAELGPETRIGVYSERAAGETIALIGYLASRPGNIRAISPEQAESNDFAEFDCVLYDGDPGVANLNPVIQIGNWRVFDR